MAKPAPTDYWTFFAGEAKRGHSPLYERLSLGIGADDDLRAMASRVRPGQPQANMILGAAHYLLLEGEDHPLADHYPSVRPNAKPEGDPVPLFRDFCLKHQAPLLRLIETRVTNTNEVARSSSLYPAFDFIARETGEALRLVEIGPSAGFNLNWDRYTYHYTAGAAIVTRQPRGSSCLALEPDLRGTSSLPLSDPMPPVASRVGLELNPVNLESAEDRLWLKALIWPELTARLMRLEAAIFTARRHRPYIVVGDALMNLERTVGELPSRKPVTVFHSHVTYQFNDEMRRRLDDILKTLAHTRPIYRVSIEWQGDHNYPVTVERYENGSVDARTIALCDPHGAWLEWRGP